MSHFQKQGESKDSQCATHINVGSWL